VNPSKHSCKRQTSYKLPLFLHCLLPSCSNCTIPKEDKKIRLETSCKYLSVSWNVWWCSIRHPKCCVLPIKIKREWNDCVCLKAFFISIYLLLHSVPIYRKNSLFLTELFMGIYVTA
jgi:hypothetical protein